MSNSINPQGGPAPHDRPIDAPDTVATKTGDPFGADQRDEALAQGLDPEEVAPLADDEDRLRLASSGETVSVEDDD